MKLDLSMYKEGYRNIAIQINELKNNNNESEIKRLESVIAENEAQIKNWNEPYEFYDYPESIQKNEYNKDFENYARPFNEEIRKAQNRIAELQSNIGESQEQIQKNRESQKQLLVHMQTARKNAEEAYKEARKQLEDEWENSSEKEQYDSKLELIALLQDKKDRTSEENQVLINALSEVRNLKMAQNTKIEELEKQYKEFLQEIDGIDEEYEIKKLQKEFELELEAEPVQEQKTESEPEQKPMQTPKQEPKPEQKAVQTPKQEPKVEPKPVQTQKPVQSQKFSYTFSKKGINYDGKQYSPKKLLDFYNEPVNQVHINQMIEDILKDKKDVETFINSADRLIYLSIIRDGLRYKEDGKTVLFSNIAKNRLIEYYNIWDNPVGQEKSNMSITYDFKGFSRLSRYFTGDKIPPDELENIKYNAFGQRKRNNVEIKNEGLFTKLRFKMKDWMERTVERIKLIDESGYKSEAEKNGRNVIDSAKAFRQNLQSKAQKITYKPKHLTTKSKENSKAKKKDEGR